MEKYLFELKKYFGYDSFREGQYLIIDNILSNKKDILTIMATGHGKSICYQLPPLITNGISIVISPLISLMNDQVIQLQKLGISSCTFNSLTEDRQNVYTSILNGDYRVVYTTPETLVNIIHPLKNCNITLIAIDECHCITQWGATFRPSYLLLSTIKDVFPNVPVLALTGTASAYVEKDIIKQLKLVNPLIIRTSPDRPNLTYIVKRKTTIINDLQLLNNNESTIIYCQTVKTTEKIAKIVKSMNLSYGVYYADLDSSVRNDIHTKFLNNEIQIVISTIAFGIGINKPNIRTIIHYGSPRDLESYVQEIGRAGRDGNQSTCYVFYNENDFHVNGFFLKDISDPDMKTYKKQKQVEMEKYLYLSTCRRHFLIKYFTDSTTEPHFSTPNQNQNLKLCCDICMNTIFDETNKTCMSDTIDVTEYVTSFLKLVYKYQQKYGKCFFINIFRGSNDKKITMEMKNLSVYGRYKDKSLNWWKILVQHVIHEKLLMEISVGYGNVLCVSTKGVNFINNFLTMQIRSSILTSSENTKVSTSNSATETETETKTETMSTLSDTCNKTYLMFNSGKSIKEIATERKLTPSTIENHIATCVANGYNIDFERIGLTQDIILEIKTLMKTVITDKLSEIKEKCGKHINYLHIKCVKNL